jgi:hypothetical protein
VLPHLRRRPGTGPLLKCGVAVATQSSPIYRALDKPKRWVLRPGGPAGATRSIGHAGAAPGELPHPLGALRHQGRRDQLVQYLRRKHLLLLLDNGEHLLPCLDFMADLLAAAPGLQVLVASREALNLQEEWRHPLSGLAVPDAAASREEAMRSEAVELFVERAHRARRDFTLDSQLEAVVRVCRLVEGMPLAIELAAAWTKTLSC